MCGRLRDVAIGVPSLSVVQIEFHQAHVGRGSISASWTSASRNEGTPTYVVHLSGNKGQSVGDQDGLPPTSFQLSRDKSRGTVGSCPIGGTKGLIAGRCEKLSRA